MNIRKLSTFDLFSLGMTIKGGKSRALEAYRITLCDGAAVVLQGAHALMDGYTFYRIAGDWGKITFGTPVDAMTVDQTLLPDAGALTKEQALCRVQDLGWSFQSRNQAEQTGSIIIMNTNPSRSAYVACF